MNKRPAVARLFEYRPKAIQLMGFPPSPFLNSLCRTLGKEESLKGHRGIDQKGRAVVLPCFPLEYAEQRQRFFKKLDGHPKIGREVFQKAFPKKESQRYSTESFVDFCQEVYGTLKSAKSELEPLRYLPEARGILRKIDAFEGEFGEKCKMLDALDEMHTFVIDTQKGEIRGIPDGADSEREKQAHEAIEYSLNRVKVKIKNTMRHPTLKVCPSGKSAFGGVGFGRALVFWMLGEPPHLKRWGFLGFPDMKKTALDIVKMGKENFMRGIFRFADAELGFNPRVENLRGYYEQIGLPVRLHAEYGKFLSAWRNQEESREREDIWSIEEEDEGKFPLPQSTIVPVRDAEFGESYNIRNMFPLSLSTTPQAPERFVPIDFVTNRGERKFILAGLHSGGKSFLLENIVLTSIGSQFIGEKVPADSLAIPKYERVIYYRNIDNGREMEGKAVTELKDIKRIIRESKRGDLLVFDEFLDSAEASVATWLGPQLLNQLMQSEATVFVSTHRGYNFRGLERKGWTVMSPEHQIVDGQVVPSKKLKRGIPDKKINVRYVSERYKDFL